MKDIKSLLLSQGFIHGTHEYKKAYNRENWNRRSKESQRNSWNKGYQSKLLKLKEDPAYLEAQRKKWRESKERQRLKRKDAINEKQRERYKARGSAARKTIYDGRKRRDPTRGLASLIQDVRNGRRDIRELLNYTRSSLEQCRALISGGTGEELSRGNRRRKH